MPKTQDVRKELREFNKLFSRFDYKWDSAQVFHDFLIMTMCAFALDDTGEMEKERDEAMKRYSAEDKQFFNDMFYCYLKTQNEQVADGGWFDFFGAYYELLTSQKKQQGLGQFFTPESVVDMMIQINAPSPEKKVGLKVADPACGSGRMLLSYHVHYPGNFMYAADIDLICCRMTCINMMIHGCVGMVEWKNSIWPENHWRTWHINPDLYKSGRPGIKSVPVKKEKPAKAA